MAKSTSKLSPLRSLYLGFRCCSHGVEADGAADTEEEPSVGVEFAARFCAAAVIPSTIAIPVSTIDRYFISNLS